MWAIHVDCDVRISQPRPRELWVCGVVSTGLGAVGAARGAQQRYIEGPTYTGKSLAGAGDEISKLIFGRSTFSRHGIAVA